MVGNVDQLRTPFSVRSFDTPRKHGTQDERKVPRRGSRTLWVYRTIVFGLNQTILKLFADFPE